MENLGFGYNLEIYNSEIKYDGKDYKLPMVCSAYDDRDRIYTTRHSAILIDASILDMSLYHDDYIALGEPLLLETLYKSGYNGMFRTGIISDKAVIENRLVRAGVAFCDGSNELTRKWNSSFYLKIFVPDVDYSKVTIYKGVPSAYAVCDCIEHYAITHKLSIKECGCCKKPFLARDGKEKYCNRIADFPDFMKFPSGKPCEETIRAIRDKLNKYCKRRINNYNVVAADRWGKISNYKKEGHPIAAERASKEAEWCRKKYNELKELQKEIKGRDAFDLWLLESDLYDKAKFPTIKINRNDFIFPKEAYQ